MKRKIYMVRETIESHLGELCPIEDIQIAEMLELMGDDITAGAVEEALEEVLGNAPDWDEELYDDIASNLLEASVGVQA